MLCAAPCQLVFFPSSGKQLWHFPSFLSICIQIFMYFLTFRMCAYSAKRRQLKVVKPRSKSTKGVLVFSASLIH